MWEGLFMRSLSRLAAACVAVMALCGVTAATAFGAYGVQLTATPADPTAGAHSDLTVKLAFSDTSTTPKNLVLHLPAGLLGDPNAVTACPRATFQANGCTSASQVGTVTTSAVALGIPLDIPGEIYVISPAGGEPARLGIHLQPNGNPLIALLSLIAPLPPINLESPISARAPGGDYGLDSTINDIPKQSTAMVLGFIPMPLDISVSAMSMTLWGSRTAHPSMKSSFLVNPTTCTPATTTVDVTAYDGSTVTGSSAFTPTHCDTIGFKPSVTMIPSTFKADQPAGVAVQIAFPDGDIGGRAQSQVRTAKVVTPPGFVLSAGVAADGLEGCTDAQFAKTVNTDPTCPALSEIGTVSFVSPLLGELKGNVWLALPTPDAPMRLFAYARKGDVRVKLIGTTSPDPQTGQLTTTFSGVPPQPFKTFTLSFRGGDTAVITAPQTCGQGTVTALLEPFSAPGTTKTVESPPVTVTDCPPPTFSPSVSASIDPSQAGADSHTTITIARPDGQPRLSSLSMQMPPGLLGHLGTVPMCPIDQARTGACDPSTQVGTASTTAGTGPRTVALSGPIYLTTGFDGGIAGLAAVVYAKVGPLDLGQVVSITKLSLRPGDLAIRADTEPLPQILSGVPLALRTLTLSLDRDGFMVNPTSCAAQTLDASLTAADGQTAGASAPLQATGCENLRFQPQVTASLGAPLANPSLRMNVEVPAGDANVKSLAMSLPKEVGANLKALSGACTADQFAAGACPASSIVGTATALSPLIPTPLSGPVRIVMTTGQTLPDLVIDLTGFTDLQLRIHNDFPGGRLKSTIDGVPDVPLSSFVLDLKGGGLLQTVDVKKICSAKPTVEGAFVAHSGATANVTALATLPACAGAASTRYRTTASLKGIGKHRTPSLTVKVRGSKLKSLRITLPKQLKLNGKKLKRGGSVLQGGKRVSRTTKAGRRALGHTKRTVTARTTKRSTGSIEIKLAKGALRKGKGLKVGKRVTLKLRVTNSAGKHQTITVHVKARK